MALLGPDYSRPGGPGERVSQIYVPRAPAPAPTAGGAAPDIDLTAPTAQYGAVIPRTMGIREMGGFPLWWGTPKIIDGKPYFTFAVSYGYNGDVDPSKTELEHIKAGGAIIWKNGTKYLPGDWSFTFYRGTADQDVDPTIAADKGAIGTPAYRGQTYIVFHDFPGEFFNNRVVIPSAKLVGSQEVSEVPGTTRIETFGAGLDNPFPETALMAVYNDLSGARSAVADQGRRSGKRYFEFGFNQDTDRTASAAIHFGLALDGHRSLVDSTSLSGSNHAWGYSPTAAGEAFYFVGPGGRDPSSATSEHRSTRGAFAVDLGTGEYWVKGFTDADWNGDPSADPATGVGGRSYLTGMEDSSGNPYTCPQFDGVTLYPAIGFESGAEGAAFFSFNDAMCADSPPTGFVYWDDAWSGGAAGTITLQSYMEMVQAGSSLDLGDVTYANCDDPLLGGAIVADTQFGDFGRTIARVFGKDFYEGDTIKVIGRSDLTGYTPDLTLAVADILGEVDRAVGTTRGEDDSPASFQIHYIDNIAPSKWSFQQARRKRFPVRTTLSDRKAEVTVGVISDAPTMLSHATRAMFREFRQNVPYAYRLPLRLGLGVTPGDIHSIPADPTTTAIGKVAKWALEVDLSVSIVATELLTNESLPMEADGGNPAEPYDGRLAPVNLTLPAISGVGPLSVVPGTWSGLPAPALTYVWELDGVEVQTGPTYDPDGVTGALTVIETATNSKGSVSAASLPHYRLAASAGTFAVAGQNAALFTGLSYTLEMETGVFNLSGQDAALKVNTTLTMEPGVFTLSGQSVNLIAPVTTDVRVTTSGDTRVTTSGDTRILSE